MKTQIVFDPLTQPLEVYVDLLKGISDDFKNWLKELGAGKSLMEWQFDALRSLLEDLSRVAGRVEEQKALFLFSDWKAGVHTPSNLWFELASVKFTTTEKVVKPIFGPGYGPKNPLARGRVQSDQRSAISYPTKNLGACPEVLHSKALRCFDREKLEVERLKIIPALFFQKYGIFYHCTGRILPAIKKYAEENPVFREKYEEAKINIRENSSCTGRVEMYLRSANPYPLNLIAELEGIAESDLVPKLLPFFYWGKDVYLVMYHLYRGDTSKDFYRQIPRWNCGNHVPLPFIGYAAVKKDVNILRAVFKGTEPVEALRILVRLFYANNDRAECRCYENWLDKAIAQDFYEEHLDRYQEYRGLLINPDEEDKAELFLEYAAELLGQDIPDVALPLVQMFFPAAAPEENRDIMAYLDYIEGMGKNETAYWQLLKLVVDRAARFPVAELLPRERFRNYTRGDMGKSAFYLLEMYLNNIKPDRETLILLGAYICVVFENQRIDTPELLPWLFCCTRFSELCTPFINEPDFLTALLHIALEIEGFTVIKYQWINYVLTLWLLVNYRDRTPNPVWPVLAGKKTQKHFDDGENPLYTAAALLLSEGEIKAEPVLLDAIRNLLAAEKAEGCIVVGPDFIPYRYFIRVNEDEGKDTVMLGELRSEVLDELLVMRYLKVHKKFDSSDFILGLNNMEDNHIAGFVEKAAEETEPEYLRLYTLLALYAGEPERIDKALDETPEKAAIIIERCKRRLAMLRNIPASSPEADDRRHYYHTALYAACFVAGRTSCWNGLKPLLLAFRRADTALLEPDLRPAGGIEENIAAQIDRFLRWDWGDEKMKNLRRDMANDLSNYLKPRKIRAGDVTGQRNGGPEYGGYERGLEGFDRKLTEPNPLWRYAYVRALGDLAVDSGGNGRLIHNTLDKTAENDPAPPVREGAKKTAEQLRRIRGGYETDFHNRCLLQAFWWMCRAHLQTLGIPFDEAVALKTRNTEYR